MPLANHASCIHKSPSIFKIEFDPQDYSMTYLYEQNGRENATNFKISFFEISGNNFYEVGIRTQKDDNSQPILTIHCKNILDIKIEGDGTLWEFQIQWMS